MSATVRRTTFILIFLAISVPLSTCASEADSVNVVFTGLYRGRAFGCTCPDGSVGGLARRMSLMNERYGSDMPLGVDCGGYLDLDPQGGKFRSLCTFYGLAKMGLKAALVTPRDCFYGVNFVRHIADTAGVNLVCANIIDKSSGRCPFPLWITFEKKGLVFAVTGLIKHEPNRRITGAGNWGTCNPCDIMEELQRKIPIDSNVFILLTNMSDTELDRFTDHTNMFDFVITSSRDLHHETPFFLGNAMVIKPVQDGGAVDELKIPVHFSNPHQAKVEHFPIYDNIDKNRLIEEWIVECDPRK